MNLSKNIIDGCFHDTIFKAREVIKEDDENDLKAEKNIKKAKEH